MEYWKQINDNYEVSNYGKVRSIDSYIKASNQYSNFKYLKKGKVLKQFINPQGYLTIRLNSKTYRVHRLVANAFLIKPLDWKYVNQKTYHGYSINHKDGNKTNNHVSNLEWVTHEENIDHAITTGLKGKLTKEHKRAVGLAHSKKVRCIETKEIFNSAREAAIQYNIKSINSVSRAANPNQTQKTAGGFHWEFPTELV
jgi:hypothetical protein